MRLFVFHYHLLSGGVTDVVINSLRAVAGNRSDITEIRLVAGRADNCGHVVERIGDVGAPVSFDVLPEIDYSEPTEENDAPRARATALEQVLLERYGADDALWWVHNYHLGKNPAFTLALCRIAERSSAPRMLLHVHDFPECARYENLAYLTRIAGPSPYPAGPAVRYAVINERDRALLVDAGVPAERVGLLLNPLPTAAGGADSREVAERRADATDAHGAPGLDAVSDRVRARLADFAADHGQRFHPDGPVLLYPIRTIRRKNVLEIAAIARLIPHANLVVTLPGLSEPERPYSQLVRYAYENRRIHGIWGIGRHEAEYAFTFEDLAHAANLIVSSSVQEGFGLTFVNALRWRRPLLARRLDVLDGIESLFAEYPSTFYDGFRVPMRSPSITAMGAYLRMRYNERLSEVDDVLPALARERLESDLDELLSHESIDFSFLPAQMQLTVLGDLREEGYGALVKAMNGDVISAVEQIPPGDAPDRSKLLSEVLGFESYAHAFGTLVDSEQTGAPGRFEGVQQKLVKAFARIEQLRLLLGPIDHADH
ncbi:MAG: hypothetical protein ACOC0O_04725 [Spirochaetota bacterium]